MTAVSITLCVYKMKDALYYYNEGVKEQDEGNLDASLEYFYKSLSIDEHFKTYHKISQILDAQGKYEKSLYALECAYKLNGRNDKVANDYAQQLIKRERITEAVTILSTILERNPTYLPAIKLLQNIKHITIT